MNRAKKDLHSLQKNELGIIPHDGIPPATSKFRNTVGAPDEDSQVGQHKAGQEEGELGGLADLLGGGGLVGAVPVGSEEEVGSKGGEEEQGDDLPDDTGEHDVGADVLGGLGFGAGGETAAGALQDKGEDVAADEDPGVPARGETRVAGTEGQDEVFQGEVDGCGEEGLGGFVRNKGGNSGWDLKD